MEERIAIRSLASYRQWQCQFVALTVANRYLKEIFIRNDFVKGGAIAQRKQTINTQPVVEKKRQTHKKGRIKFSTLSIYASIFGLLVVMIAIGYRSPVREGSTPANVVQADSGDVENHHAEGIVNNVVATDVAARVAAATNLSVAPSVASLAASTKFEAEAANLSDSQSISKPVIIEASTTARGITKYTAVEGDTVESIAAKFKISADTVKWANNLTSNTVAVGSQLDILSRDGIAYVVKGGDTLESIASKYKSNASLITSYNDLEISGLVNGSRIIIPGGVLPSNERPGYVAPVLAQYAGYSAGFLGGDTSWTIRRGTPMYAGNKYATGNCTAYVYDRRVELGKPVGGMWGNAVSWAAAARAAGYSVTNQPSVGSIIQNGGGAGHVAIVEKILPNGDLELSEMNATYKNGGWNIVSGRILPASAVGQYLYIH